mgnify:CR=1 FL=1
MKIGKEVFEDLIKQCWVSEWFGLTQYFDLNKFLTLAEHRGLIGDLWDKKAKELLLTTYHHYAIRNQIDENTIDKDLKLIAEKLSLDLNELRQLFYFGLKELAPEKPSKGKPPEETPVEKTPETKSPLPEGTQKDEIELEGEE